MYLGKGILRNGVSFAKMLDFGTSQAIVAVDYCNINQLRRRNRTDQLERLGGFRNSCYSTTTQC